MKQEELDNLSTEDKVAYWKGRLLLAIGKGDLDSELWLMMDYFTRLGYSRGIIVGKQTQ